MNLMFRKNFREGASGKSGGGGSKLQPKANRTKRSRDLGLSSQPEDIHYRTHLFFSPNRPGYDVGEERCSAFTGAYTQLPTTVTSLSPTMQHEMDVPQPLVDRKPSISHLRWNNGPNRNSISTKTTTTTTTTSTNINNIYSNQQQFHNNNNSSIRNIAMTEINTSKLVPASLGVTGLPTSSAARQASFAASGSGGAAGGGLTATRSEPVSLTALDRDCFIIPVHSVDRFLPAGIPLPSSPVEGSGHKTSSPLSVLEVSDPKLCVLVHLMSPLEPIDPVLESPLAHPLLKQRAVASELLTEVQQANTAVGGMLLANMEKCAEFPFITYYVINTTQTDPSNFYTGIRVSSLSKFEPKNLKYTAAHTLDLYSEVAAICRPPLQLAPSESGSFKKTQTSATGYIISVFKVFEGDDGERFEKNWLYWTGARMLYRYLPHAAGLRRISLHKSTSHKGDKMYLLISECAELLKDVTSAAVLIPALRARLCGYTGLYRPIQAF